MTLHALLDQLTAELDDLRARERYRSCRSWQARDARTVSFDGRRLLNVSANDYLGLAHDPDVIEAGIAAARAHGWGGAASRLIVGQSPVYDELEAALAAHKGAESALVFSSGYHANLALVASLVDAGDAVFTDERNHASLWDACRLSRARVYAYRHNDADDLDRLLRRAARPRRRLLVATDGVFSMDGDVAPLPELLAVCERHGAQLLVDDAHGYGVLGPRGAGTAAMQGLACDRVIAMGTLSKCVGGLGGYFAGPARLREGLIQKARTLIYTTALPVPVVAAARAAVEKLPALDAARGDLQARAARLRQGLRARGYDTGDSATQIVPIIVGGDGDALRLMQRFLDRDILAVAIRPPTVPEGSARVRLSLSAAHTDADIEAVLDALDGA